MIKNRFGVFHAVIIALLLAVMGGCGYKKSPYYPKKEASAQQGGAKQ